MGKLYRKPLTIEQKKKLIDKEKTKSDQELKNDQDLLNAYLLEQLAELKGKVNTND